jgi:hypothetical protein
MNESPGRLLSELTASINAIRKRVPAGITVFGSGLSLSNSPPVEVDFDVESALVVDGSLLHPIKPAASAATSKK